MDLSEATAYHGKPYSHREIPEGGDYRVETTSADAIRAGVDGLACLTRRVD